MSRSKHTDPHAIRASRRIRNPFSPRGAGDLALRRKLGSMRKEFDGFASSYSDERVQRAHHPRVHCQKPNAGFYHPAGEQRILELLKSIGPLVLYGLRTIELTRTPLMGNAFALAFGRYETPGSIYLFEQPLPPWRLPGLLTKETRKRFERAGAVMNVIPQSGVTLVDWPIETLPRFMLEEVLLHELGHHVLQHYKGKRKVRIARTRDHEAFATQFAEVTRGALMKRSCL